MGVIIMLIDMLHLSFLESTYN